MTILELLSFVALSLPTVKVSGERLSVESPGDELRVRSFQAYKRDGRVEGTAVLAVPGPDPARLQIDCIRAVDADTLLIGGIISNAEFLPDRTRAVFAVRDGGEGDRARDFVSALHEGTCECDDPFTTLVPIEGGDIEIAGR